MSTHRREVRPRYGRIAALAASVTVTVVAALAGLGIVTAGSADAGLSGGRAAYTSSAPTTGPTGAVPSTSAAAGDLTSGGTPTPGGVPSTSPVPTTSAESSGTAVEPAVLSVPAGSGTGRRIVFSESLQRVWLVDQDDAPQRSYLVSGSLFDNLQPGTYDVTRRERHAIGIDDSGTMEYFVVFTAGPTGAAIGFHSIPVKDGRPVQTKAQLGTPQSHGCIRQTTPDAIALWNFAPLGTKVVVVA